MGRVGIDVVYTILQVGQLRMSEELFYNLKIFASIFEEKTFTK